MASSSQNLRRRLGHAGIYALLLAGAVLFSWPFVWMVFTSVKVDRELFRPSPRLFPDRPGPVAASPYVDTVQFRDAQDPRSAEILPLVEARLDLLDFEWPVELDRATAQRQTARGIVRKLANTVPSAIWQGPLDPIQAEIDQRITPEMVRDILGQVRRSLAIGSLRVRSEDLAEEELIPAEQVGRAWTISGDADRAEIVPSREGGLTAGELRYDFGGGREIRLKARVATSFPLERLAKIELGLRPDDTWHRVMLEVEKRGVRYRAERPVSLVGFNPLTATWQEPGPDDETNKIKTWTLLRETARGGDILNDPHAMKLTLIIERNTASGAWRDKIARNYVLALDHIPFWRYIATSTFLVILNIVGTLFSSSLVAYSFARLRWPGRGLCFALMLATMMIPPQVTMIPYFLIIRWLGWYNTLYPLWIGSLFAGAFNVFLLLQFMKGIPRDLEDAALIDGCGFWRVYWHVMLPLVKPTLAAIGVFTFMGVWNDFMGPLIFLSDQRLYPLSLGLYAFNVQSGGNMAMMMAGALLMTVPVIVIFFFAQRYFIQGISLTGSKG